MLHKKFELIPIKIGFTFLKIGSKIGLKNCHRFHDNGSKGCLLITDSVQYTSCTSLTGVCYFLLSKAPPIMLAPPIPPKIIRMLTSVTNI